MFTRETTPFEALLRQPSNAETAPIDWVSEATTGAFRQRAAQLGVEFLEFVAERQAFEVPPIRLPRVFYYEPVDMGGVQLRSRRFGRMSRALVFPSQSTNHTPVYSMTVRTISENAAHLGVPPKVLFAASKAVATYAFADLNAALSSRAASAQDVHNLRDFEPIFQEVTTRARHS